MPSMQRWLIVTVTVTLRDCLQRIRRPVRLGKTPVICALQRLTALDGFAADKLVETVSWHQADLACRVLRSMVHHGRMSGRPI